MWENDSRYIHTAIVEIYSVSIFPEPRKRYNEKALFWKRIKCWSKKWSRKKFNLT